MVPDEDHAAHDPSSSKKGKEKRGFFGRLKDKAIGTKEEREAYKREMARVRTTQSSHTLSLQVILFRSKERDSAGTRRC
jgi:hypothetical protein